jgi:nickel transport protein
MHRPFFVLAALSCLALTSRASAHDLGATYTIRDGRVEIEAYFDDDTPAAAARVAVTDSAGKLVAEGKTDRAGRWSFPVPADENYRIVVDHGDGHRHVIDVGRGGSQPSRTEFTRTPWIKIGLGLFLIALVAFGLGAALRTRRMKREALNRDIPATPAHPSPPGPT